MSPADPSLPDPYPAADPLAALHDEGNGVGELRAARDLLRAGDPGAARETLARARARGIPAAGEPFACMLEAAALLDLDDADAAAATLRAGWASWPDAAGIPALLGVAAAQAGDQALACRVLLAALVDEDPDDTLAFARPHLTRLLRRWS